MCPSSFYAGNSWGKPWLCFLQCRQSFQRETLEFLGVNQQNYVIDCDRVSLIRAASLIVPCHQIMNGRGFSKWVFDILRPSFFAICKARKVPVQANLPFSPIGSAQASKNESEIVPLLENYGFPAGEAGGFDFPGAGSNFSRCGYCRRTSWKWLCYI